MNESREDAPVRIQPLPPVRPGRLDAAERERLKPQVAARYRAGASVRTIAGELGRSYGGTYRLLVDSGVEFRSRGGAGPDTEESHDLP